MDKLAAFIFVLLLGLVGLYGVGTFVAWDLNPAHWDPIGRALISILSVGWLVLLGSIAANEK